MTASRSTPHRPRPATQRGKVDGFMLGMLAAVLLASAWPDLGRSGGLLHADQLGNIGIFVIFFLHGTGLSSESLLHGASRWRLHLLVQLCTFALFPLWWLLLKTLLGSMVPPELVLGFFYLAVLPSTVSSSVAMTALARGNVAAAVLNASLSTLIGAVLTPLLASLVFTGANGQSMEVGHTMLKIAQMLLLPFALGQLARQFAAAFFKKIKPVTTLVDRGVILLLVWCSFSDSVADGLWRNHGWGLLAMTLVGAALFLFPMLWFTQRVARAMGFPVADEIVAVFCGSKKTLASGVPMARLLFAGSPTLGIVVLPIMAYHQLQLFVCSWLARRYAARPMPSELPEEPQAGVAPAG